MAEQWAYIGSSHKPHKASTVTIPIFQKKKTEPYRVKQLTQNEPASNRDLSDDRGLALKGKPKKTISLFDRTVETDTEEFACQH